MEVSAEQETANRGFMELVADGDDPPRDCFRYGYPLTAMRDIVDFLNRAIQDQINCPHDILRSSSTEGGCILSILECVRCGLIQEARH